MPRNVTFRRGGVSVDGEFRDALRYLGLDLGGLKVTFTDRTGGIIARNFFAPLCGSIVIVTPASTIGYLQSTWKGLSVPTDHELFLRINNTGFPSVFRMTKQGQDRPSVL